MYDYCMEGLVSTESTCANLWISADTVTVEAGEEAICNVKGKCSVNQGQKPEIFKGVK